MKTENINDAIKPEYYNTNSLYEPWKIIDACGLDFYLGTALKYILRAGKKPHNPPTQDLRKAIECIKHEIEMIEK